MLIEHSSQRIRAAMIDNAPQMWSAQHQRTLESSRINAGILHAGAVKLALATALQDVPENSMVVDFGMGDGFFYPLPLKQNINLIAIDPAKKEVKKAIKNGKVKSTTQIISKKSPPYSEIPPMSVDAIVGVSSFHLLINPNMQAVFADLSQKRLKKEGMITHIQDIGPLANFFVDIDIERLQKMEGYLLDKYQTNALKVGDVVAENGGWWGMVYDQCLKELNSWGAWLADNGSESFRFVNSIKSEVNNFPRIKDHASAVQKVSQMVLNGQSLGKYLQSDGGIGMAGIALANEKLENVLKQLPKTEQENQWRHWQSSMMMAVYEVNQDWLEAYLATSFFDLGMRVYVDRVTILGRVPESNGYVHNVDGFMRVGEVSGTGGYTLSSVRRVQAVKV